MAHRDLLKLSLPRAVFELAWPAIAATMMINLFNLVDAFWVARLGTDALGGMSAASFVFWCLHAVGQLVGTGVTAVVARRVGQARPADAGLAAGHGLVLALGLAGLTMALTLPLLDGVVGLLALSPELARNATDYLTPILWGFPTITCWYAMEAAFRGSGDARTPMVVLGATLTLNTLLDPWLIFGWGPVPAMGVAGAAWATVLSNGAAVALSLAWLRRRDVRPRLVPGPRLQPSLLLSLMRVGTPISVSAFLFSVIYIVLTRLIASFGSPAVAAVGVGHRVEGLVYFTCIGFSAAASTLVGQNLGAGRPRRAAAAAWLSTGYAAAISLLLAVLFFALAEPIFRVFSDDPAVLQEGAAYLRIIAVFEVGSALELVLEGAFAGAGNSLPPMLVSVPLTAARVPAAHWLTRHTGLGVRGVWWAISGSTALKALVIGLWFRLNRWQRSRV